MEWLADYGVIGLFVAAFLAATVLPLSSELVLVALLLAGSPGPLLVAVATVGNVLGAVTGYALGWWGGPPLLHRWLRVGEADLQRARHYYRRYGHASLLLSGVPIIGDPLTLLAGILRAPLWLFLVWVTLGKLGRYLLVAAMV